MNVNKESLKSLLQAARQQNHVKMSDTAIAQAMARKPDRSVTAVQTDWPRSLPW